MIVDECHHIPAAAFENAVRQIPARRWLGMTATPYRHDGLDDLITLQLGPVRSTMTEPEPGTLAAAADGVVERALAVHQTRFVYRGDADPTAPGGIAAVYRDLVADVGRNRQIVADVQAASRGTALPGPDKLDCPRRDFGSCPLRRRARAGDPARRSGVAETARRPRSTPS